MKMIATLLRPNKIVFVTCCWCLILAGSRLLVVQGFSSSSKTGIGRKNDVAENYYLNKVIAATRTTTTTSTTTTKLQAAPASYDDVSAWNDLSQKLLGEMSSKTTATTSASSSSGSSSSFVNDAMLLPGALLRSIGESISDNIGAGNFDLFNVDFSSLQEAIQQADISSSTIPVIFLALAAPMTLLLVAAATFYTLSHPPLDYREGMEPYARGFDYDPIQAKAYYSRHPLLVARRLAQVLRLSNKFLFNYLVDKYIFRDADRNRPQRAQELLTLITQLGPTAIKIGQALSVRPDIINEDYSKALATLQDQVPPFDSDVARDLLRQELGLERLAHFTNLNDSKMRQPVASASIGQVYKSIVVNDSDGTEQEVAIKVQRPNVLAEIALDLYLVRELAPLYQALTKSSSDLQALANEWGRGFIVELDYTKEAAATMRFNQEMQARNLNAVCAPTVLKEYSTQRILVTEWVDGTRLDQSDAQDIPRLCSVALNAYLVMLLELQSLHCDPHPGNLLRTPDGRLCILDFGMTLDIDPNLQYSLLEYVAHLTAEDYDSLPEDFAKLGFLKPEKLEFARRSGVLEPLKYFLKQVGQGGGAKRLRERIFDEYREKFPGMTDDELQVEMRSEMKQKIQDIAEQESVATGITMEVEDLQRQNKDAFQIPPWFLYTSRAFLTLEGVSLQSDPDYSIIKSCFPYVAKRLVADDDPRARKALKDLLYGAGESVDVKRLTDLADGFSSYTTTTKTINQQANALPNDELVLTTGNRERISKRDDRKKRMVEAEAAITLAKDSADILLAPEGNLVQNLLVQESALATSARVKDRLRETLVDGPEKFRQSLPFGFGSFLPPLPLEFQFKKQFEPFVRKTTEELKAQELAEKFSTLIPLPTISSFSSNEDGSAHVLDPAAPTSVFLSNVRELEPEQAALLLKEIRENAPRYAPMLRRLGNKFASTLLQTASSNIDTTLTELEHASGDGGRVRSDPLFRTTVKGLSRAAQQRAQALTANNEEGGKPRGRRRSSRSKKDTTMSLPPPSTARVVPASLSDDTNLLR